MSFRERFGMDSPEERGRRFLQEANDWLLWASEMNQSKEWRDLESVFELWSPE